MIIQGKEYEAVEGIEHGMCYGCSFKSSAVGFCVNNGLTSMCCDDDNDAIFVEVKKGSEEPVVTEWTDEHYNGYYHLTDKEMREGRVKIDPYFVARQWLLGTKDSSGVLFHILKTIARFGEKNPREREIRAIYNQVKRMAELEGVKL